MSAARWRQRGQTFPDAFGLWFPTGELRIMGGRLEQRFKVRIYRTRGHGWGEYFDWRTVPVVRNSATGDEGRAPRSLQLVLR